MRFDYNPNSEYEKFGVEINKLLAKQFPQSFFVGGLVRDCLLQRKITDVDIATSAQPEEIITTLQNANIGFIDQGKQFGVITAEQGSYQVEIATFRAEEYVESRFPKVRFLDSPIGDSTRRDFTMNALYLNFNSSEILDYHGGIEDIQNKLIRFIGNAEQRIKEDPLRIVRAYRFQKTLNFDFDDSTKQILFNSHHLLKTINKQRIESEINKISDDIVRQELRKVIHNFA